MLPSSKTRLIGCFLNVGFGKLFTVDIHCLIRQWDLCTGLCVKSYPLEKPQKEGNRSSLEQNLNHFKQRHKIQAVEVCPDKRGIAIAFQGGSFQLNNLHSGTVLFNKAYENMLDLGP